MPFRASKKHSFVTHGYLFILKNSKAHDFLYVSLFHKQSVDLFKDSKRQTESLRENTFFLLSSLLSLSHLD